MEIRAKNLVKYTATEALLMIYLLTLTRVKLSAFSGLTEQGKQPLFTWSSD